jgi:hypothetical protein
MDNAKILLTFPAKSYIVIMKRRQIFGLKPKWLLVQLIWLVAISQPPIPLVGAGWASSISSPSGFYVNKPQQAVKPVNQVCHCNRPEKIRLKNRTDQ